MHTSFKHLCVNLAIALGLGTVFATPWLLPSLAQTRSQPAPAAPSPEPPTEQQPQSSPVQSSSPQPTQILPVAAEDIQLSESGRRLLSVSSHANGKLVQVWDSREGDRLFTLATPEVEAEVAPPSTPETLTPFIQVALDRGQRIQDVALSPGGTQVAVLLQEGGVLDEPSDQSRSLRLQLWNVDTGDLVWDRPLGHLTHEQDSDLVPLDLPLMQVEFGTNRETLLTHVALAFDADHQPTDVRLRLHNLQTGAVIRDLNSRFGTSLNRFEFSPDGQRLMGAGHLTTESAGGQTVTRPVVEVWHVGNELSGIETDDSGAANLGDRSSIYTLTPASDFFSLVDWVVYPDGRIATLSQNLYEVRLEIWDSKTGDRLQQITDIPGIDRQDRLGCLSPDGDYYFVRSDVAGTRLIHLGTQQVISLPVYAEAAAFDRESKILAIATQQGVQIYALPLLSSMVQNR